MPTIESDGDELPVGAWFQLYQDLGGLQTDGLAFYVREYGLLVANKHTAPPDAPTVTQFWQTKLAPKGGRPAEVIAPTKFAFEGKYHGRAITLPDEGGAELLRLTLKLAHADKTTANVHPGRVSIWGGQGPVDYLRFQAPVARDFKLDYEGPVEVLVDLTPFPGEIGMIRVWTADRTLTYQNFQPGAAKEFAAVVAKVIATK
jgi:hypothetical protein